MRRAFFSCVLALAGAGAGHGQDTPPNVERLGFELVRSAPPLPPPIDRRRMAQQIEDGCSEGGVRYAGMAGMRGGLPPMRWTEEVRRLASAAAIADDYEAARELIVQAGRRAAGDARQQAVLINLQVQTALQFRRLDAARSLLAEASDGPLDLPAPLLSDRLFWRAYLAINGAARPETWREDIAPFLDRARAADPTSFQVRMLGVVAFLKSAPWHGSASCHSLVGEFSERVLSVTEGSACPLMLGHISHGLDRALVARPVGTPGNAPEAWHLLATGLLSVLVGNGPQAAAALAGLEQAAGEIRCGQVMLRGLADVVDLAR